MMPLPTVLLRPGEADRVLAGHPWLYRNSIDRISREAATGDWVQVKDHRQRFLGCGFFHATSKIAVRVLTPERATPDTQFFQQRIQAARDLRSRLLPAATTYRMVNSEADFLSGLIVDKYEDALVLQITSAGMDRCKPAILAALRTLFAPVAIVERGDVASRKFEGLPQEISLVEGNLPQPFIANLGGLKFQMDLMGGHKTGAYLDQQHTHVQVARHCAGARVLDCFTFQGGFAIHAAHAGAVQVHALDQSEDALTIAAANARHNGVESRCTFEKANIFDWLKAASPQTSQHDVIILDPPSFTRNRASVPDALRGYKEIHLRALRLLPPGGLLATFCCSHHVDAPLFMQVILDAARDARRVLRLREVYSQSHDHPIIPAIPETEYLKGFALEIAR